MINFTMGPVQQDKEIRSMGAEQLPYFRTEEFSQIMHENESFVKKLANADLSSRVVFLTASGTAAMEAAVMNLFTEKDKVIVINGGGFGQRFVNLCQIHNISYTEIALDYFQPLTIEQLIPYEKRDILDSWLIFMKHLQGFYTI